MFTTIRVAVDCWSNRRIARGMDIADVFVCSMYNNVGCLKKNGSSFAKICTRIIPDESAGQEKS